MRFLIITILAIVSLSACDNRAPAETAGKKIDETVNRVGEKLDQQAEKTAEALDDTAITARVKTAIFAEPGLKALQINVDTAEGVVTLSGSVDSIASSNRAADLAGAMAGVRRVDNRLMPK